MAPAAKAATATRAAKARAKVEAKALADAAVAARSADNVPTLPLPDPKRRRGTAAIENDDGTALADEDPATIKKCTGMLAWFAGLFRESNKLGCVPADSHPTPTLAPPPTVHFT
jgi:hypothetical protein